MKISAKLKSGVLTIALNGELDECCADYVKQSFASLVSEAQPQKVVFDFSLCNFMDSTGIGVLLLQYRKYNSQGIKFFIFHPSQSIDKIMKMSGIYQIMPRLEERSAVC